MNRKARHTALLALPVSLLVIGQFAHAAHTSVAIAESGDKRFGIAWFNSGDSTPSRGYNFFTLKAEKGSKRATLKYQIDGEPPQFEVVEGSEAERDIPVVVSGPLTTPRPIRYSVCAVDYDDNQECSEEVPDVVQ